MTPGDLESYREAVNRVNDTIGKLAEVRQRVDDCQDILMDLVGDEEPWVGAVTLCDSALGQAQQYMYDVLLELQSRRDGSIDGDGTSTDEGP